MTRPLRIEFPGATYHITSRGNRRGSIYRRDADRITFLAVLAQVCERFRWSCSAYCLMTNHYHLVVETPQANLARGMRQLNGLYTQRFNRGHRCVGHLYQGRYSAILVNRELHLLAVIRYVLLNPVRARMVKTAAEWPWSSYRATIGEAPSPQWLQSNWLLSVFGSDSDSGSARNLAFAQFVQDGLVAPSCWQSLTHQIYLGDADFVASALAQLPNLRNLAEVPRIQRSSARKPLNEPGVGAVEKPPGDRLARNRAIAAAFSTGHYTMREIAEHFCLHYSQVSRIVHNIEIDNAARCKT